MATKISNHKLKLSLRVQQKPSTDPAIGVEVYDPQLLHAEELDNGTGDSQANSVCVKTISHAAGAGTDHDLTAITDDQGRTFNFSKVKEVILECDSASPVSLYLGGAAANGLVGPFASATGKGVAGPGGIVAASAPVAGWTVTGGTGDLLRTEAAAGSGTSTGTLIIVGVGT